MSLQSHPSLSLLSGDCGHLEKTDAYLGLWCKSPLKWVLTVIPSHCLGWQLSWGNNLMIPCLMNTGQRNEWKYVMKGIFETCIVYQVAFHECGPLHQSGLTPAIYYIHRWHLSHLSPQGHLCNNNIRAATYNWPCDFFSCCCGSLHGILNDCLCGFSFCDLLFNMFHPTST